MRESLFNLLTNGPRGDLVGGARVLDLFAGTGALGLEALSRGAAHVTFVETGRVAQDLIGRNVERLGCADAVTLLRGSALRPGRAPEPCGLVFLDPPYGRGLGERALSAAQTSGWIAPGAVVAWEEAAPVDPPPGVVRFDVRRYGQTTIMLLEADR